MGIATKFNLKKTTGHFLIALLASSAMVACSPSTSAPKEATAASYSSDEITAETARLNKWF